MKDSNEFKGMINRAQEMVEKKQTERILIPKGTVSLGGIPFMVVKVKEKQLILVPSAGYKLAWDTPHNKKKYDYVKPDAEPDC